MIAFTATRRENSVFPFFGAANDRMPVIRKLNGKQSKFTTLESRKKAKKRHTKKTNKRKDKKMYIPKKQRESLISFNERDDRVEVITYNTSLIKRLTELHNNHPDCCEITCADTEIGRYEFSVSKHNFTFRIMNPYTKERRTAMRNYAIRHGAIAAVGRKDKQNERNKN